MRLYIREECEENYSLKSNGKKLLIKIFHFNTIAFISGALLSGARNANNSDLSESIYNRMKNLFPQMSDSLKASAILLANVYAASNEVEKAREMKARVLHSPGKKKIGITWTSINGEIYVSLEEHFRRQIRTNQLLRICSGISGS